MPIKVQCACGKSFAAKDELAGKTVKCPACKQPLKIPGGNAPAAKSPAPSAGAASAAKGGPGKPPPTKAASAPAARSAPSPARSPAAPSGDSLFDEVGLPKVAAGTRPCPGCTEPLPENAVICVKCGYNTKIGRRMETVKVGFDAGAGGHGAVAADLLNKAAQVMDEDAAEDKKKTGEGLPWWVYLIVLGLLIGFATMMLLLPTGSAIRNAGWLMLAIVWLVIIYAYVNILIVAFREGILHGIGCMICGIYLVVYSIMRWEQCGMYLLTMFGAQFVGGGIQYALIQFPASEAAKQNAYLNSQPPAARQIEYDHQPVSLLKRV